MKHNLKITAILLIMFILTQFIGLYVVNHYSQTKVIDGQVQNVSAPNLPYGMQPPELKTESDFRSMLYGLLIAFVIAISLLFLLTRFNLAVVLRIWFFIVVLIALGIAFNAIFPEFKYLSLFAILLALPLTYIKIFKQNFLVHNLTELLIYPGIAAVFVPILNLWTIIALLIIISIYDIWAVWHSGVMQKMAKYQMEKLKIFSGFFVPYLSKKVKLKIQKMKSSDLKKKKIKVNVAILGGGDVIFPIIAAGVMMKVFGFNAVDLFGRTLLIPTSALLVTAGATLGLAGLFFMAEKKKFYPAMPFITAGIFAGMLLSYLL